MRVYLTGASGFVGSNVARAFAEHGAELIRPGREEIDLTDGALVRRSVAATRPDAIVHCAIWNDPAALLSDRRRAWANYVGATRKVVDAANAAGTFGPPDPAALPDGRAPFDTRLDATATAAALGAELPGLDTMLGRLRAQLEMSWSAA